MTEHRWDPPPEDLTLPGDEPNLRTDEVCRATGATYRMVDYWVRTGYVRTVDEHGVMYAEDYQPGSGSSRFYTPEEVEVTAHMVRLTYAGFILKAAHDIARAMVDPARPRTVRLRSRDPRRAYVITEGTTL